MRQREMRDLWPQMAGAAHERDANVPEVYGASHR